MNFENYWHTQPIWNVAQPGKMTTDLNKLFSQDFSAVHLTFLPTE